MTPFPYRERGLNGPKKEPVRESRMRACPHCARCASSGSGLGFFSRCFSGPVVELLFAGLAVFSSRPDGGLPSSVRGGLLVHAPGTGPMVEFSLAQGAASVREATPGSVSPVRWPRPSPPVCPVPDAGSRCAWTACRKPDGSNILPVEMAPTVLVCPVRRRPTASITGDAATASTPPSSPGHGALLTAAGTYDRPGGKACAGPPSLIGRASTGVSGR
jgi:hypothetical protein